MTFERVEIGPHTLYRGRCEDVLPTLADGSINMVLTDPPYPLVSGGRKYGIHPGSYFGDKAIVDGKGQGLLYQTPRFKEWAPLLTSACEADAEALVFTNDRNLPDLWSALESQAWRWHNLIVWDKRNVVQNMHYMKQCEFILYAFRGKSKRLRHSRPNLFRLLAPASRVHPSEKPLELLSGLIDSHEAATVLDPFMGSGTTGVACAQTGRRFVGVEIDPAYFDIACRRLQSALDETPLFAEAK